MDGKFCFALEAQPLIQHNPMMKIPSFFLSLSFSLCLAGAAFAQTPVVEWDPKTGSNAGGGVLVPSVPGGSDLQGGPDSGSNIGPADGASGDTAIIFNGTQTQPVRTAAGKQFVFSSGNAFEINFLVEPGEGEATILTTADLEVRYDHKEGNVKSILYFDTQGEGPGYKILRHPLTPGSWATLNVALMGNEFTTQMNDVTKRAVITAALRDKPSSIMLGTRIMGSAGVRPLKGKIGKIRLMRN